MYLYGTPHLCTIPQVIPPPPHNETSEALARIATQKELARATTKGWELLSSLEGDCLYFISGWWSYLFCYNADVTQFHQLGQSPGHPSWPPRRDPSTPAFVLGKMAPVRLESDDNGEDEWGHRIATTSQSKAVDTSRAGMQVKGNTRYLMQKMDGGSICDLTGKPRQIEVQFHCMPQVKDRIEYIKEVTTCSYLMVIHTPKLCSDLAFLPPKEEDAYQIKCARVATGSDAKNDAALLDTEKSKSKEKALPVIGGVVVGGGKMIGKDAQQMSAPDTFSKQDLANPGIETIAIGKSKANGGQIDMMSHEELEKLEIDPAVVEDLRREVQQMAQERGWKIEVVENPGEIREMVGIIDTEEGENDADETGGKAQEVIKDPRPRKKTKTPDSNQALPDEHDDQEQGSKEIFKDEL